jgi:hypothetical protein
MAASRPFASISSSHHLPLNSEKSKNVCKFEKQGTRETMPASLYGKLSIQHDTTLNLKRARAFEASRGEKRFELGTVGLWSP